MDNISIAKCLKQDRDNYWLLYYLVLGIIQASWTDLNVFPPAPLRFAMIIAAFGPLFIKPQFVPMAFMFNITVNRYIATNYTYLPTDINLYLFILIPLYFKNRRKINSHSAKYLKVFITLAVYWAFVDLINLGELGTYAKFCIIPILSGLFIKDEKSLHIFSAGFIMACALLSIYYYINYEKFLFTWNSAESIERSGWCDPNYFSTALGVGYMFSMLYLLGVLKSRLIVFHPIVLAACSFFIALAVVMLASRAGFICIIAITTILLFMSQIKMKWTLLAICLVIAAGYYIFTSGYFDVLYYRLFEQGNIDTAGNRTELWQMIVDNQGEQSLFYVLFGGGYWHRGVLTNGVDPHNEILAILADYGIIGLLLYLTLLFSLFTPRKNEFKIVNIPLLFYVLTVLSLSHFQYPTISFLISWICGAKMLLKCKELYNH